MIPKSDEESKLLERVKSLSRNIRRSCNKTTTLLRLYNVYILPVLPYGSDTWSAAGARYKNRCFCPILLTSHPTNLTQGTCHQRGLERTNGRCRNSFKREGFGFCGHVALCYAVGRSLPSGSRLRNKSKDLIEEILTWRLDQIFAWTRPVPKGMVDCSRVGSLTRLRLSRMSLLMMMMTLMMMMMMRVSLNDSHDFSNFFVQCVL